MDEDTPEPKPETDPLHATDDEIVAAANDLAAKFYGTVDEIAAKLRAIMRENKCSLEEAVEILEGILPPRLDEPYEPSM